MKKSISLIGISIFVIGGATVYLYLDHLGQLPWDKSEFPSGLRVFRLSPDRIKRQHLIKEKLRLELLIAKKGKEGIAVVKAEALLKKGCSLFGEGNFAGADEAFNGIPAALTPPKPTAVPKPTKPVRKRDHAKVKKALATKLQALQAKLENHPKDSSQKDNLFDTLGEAFALLDADALDEVEEKVDLIEYGLPELPK